MRTVVMSKDNSTVKVLKYFPEIYRPHVNNWMERRPSSEATGCFVTEISCTFFVVANSKIR
jgi:hypothetical protein